MYTTWLAVCRVHRSVCNAEDPPRSAECLSLLLGHSISRVYSVVQAMPYVAEVKGRCIALFVLLGPVSAVRAV